VLVFVTASEDPFNGVVSDVIVSALLGLPRMNVPPVAAIPVPVIEMIRARMATTSAGEGRR
jgi:hypothetical protein